MGLFRLLLAVSVIIAHSGAIFGLTFVGGRIAVEAFFIISGFYMSLILNEKYVHQKNSYGLFITNRFLRLFPLYWVILLLTILVTGTIAFVSHGEHLGAFRVYVENLRMLNIPTVGYLIFSNIFIFAQDIALFFGFNTVTGQVFFNSGHVLNTQLLLGSFQIIPQAWTIAIELLFYLIAPFIVRRNWKTVFSIITLTFVLRVVLWHFGFNYDPWTHRFFPTELGIFLLGNISYRIYTVIRTRVFRPIYLYSVLLYIVGFTVFFDVLPIPGKMTLYLLSCVLSLPFIFHLTNAKKFDKYVGELSYPVYLSHVLVATCVRSLSISSFAGTEGLTVTLFAILFSITLNELIAKKIERVRQRRVPASP
jgi:peptidoglycan/LPS O-acetylase OafA/YrhL